ncbi:MAG: 3-oxoacyl-[acyl-carrier-protein] reductase [Melioribacteraceae bacterium]|nr:3-oxoacyl-[acyl-carrier-protein] reductase [Ignavibacteriota bacterium]MBZ0184101.1 3-oxoacyl-[acyl-carrier-protein] reductase [Melioribacteraceae bacterium]
MQKNKVALVTGGTRGIGRSIVLSLAENLCSHLAFVYNSSDELAETLKQEIEKLNCEAFPIKSDVSNFNSSLDVVDQVVAKFGKLEILVNNAGVTKDNLLLRMTEDDYDKVLNVNLKSVFNYTKAVSRQMMKQRYGKIINITSVVGLIGNAGQSNYAASKAGIIGFTKSTAKEFASRNININAVAPGFIETDMTDALNDEQRKALLSNIPMSKMGKPEDVSNLVKFLAGDESSYITGQVITVDGGMVM